MPAGAALVLMLVLGGLLPPAARAQDDSCLYARDGECDEPLSADPEAEFYCAFGTDSTDCGRASAPGPESCPWSRDGECDHETGGTALCADGTDIADCSGAAPGPAPAEEAQRAEVDDLEHRFFGHDDRVVADAGQYPWSAIGRVEYVDGYCSGVLVAPRLVLTSAHCMFADEAYSWDAPQRFVAGRDGDAQVAEAAVVGVYIPAQFDNYLHSTSTESDGYDFAFLALGRAIGDEAGVIPVLPVTQDELLAAADGTWLTVSQGGYSYDRESVLTAHLGCAITTVWDDGTLYHECDTLEGDSGSPLIVERDGAWYVIAVDSALVFEEEGPYDSNMAVDARAFYETYARLVRAFE